MEIEVLFNGNAIKVSQAASLLEVIAKAKLADSKGIALALNGDVIPKDLWPKTQLNQNDSVLVITATQGG